MRVVNETKWDVKVKVKGPRRGMGTTEDET
jgi:hypothetical protein